MGQLVVITLGFVLVVVADTEVFRMLTDVQLLSNSSRSLFEGTRISYPSLCDSSFAFERVHRCQKTEVSIMAFLKQPSSPDMKSHDHCGSYLLIYLLLSGMTHLGPNLLQRYPLDDSLVEFRISK